jgi:hypothetical protein
MSTIEPPNLPAISQLDWQTAAGSEQTEALPQLNTIAGIPIRPDREFVTPTGANATVRPASHQPPRYCFPSWCSASQARTRVCCPATCSGTRTPVPPVRWRITT